jgi:hypothetical protein
MRQLPIACAALLVGAGVAASQGVAEAATTDQMVCASGYTFVNGICDVAQAQAGQPYEGSPCPAPTTAASRSGR